MNEVKFDETFANKIYDILQEECGATSEDRQNFVYCQTIDKPSEYRFNGIINGGKFRRNENGIYVDGYREGYNPAVEKMILEANQKIKALVAVKVLEDLRDENKKLREMLQKTAVALCNLSTYAPDPDYGKEIAQEALDFVKIQE